MKNNKVQVRWRYTAVLLWAVFICLVAAGLPGQALADESITVSCYNLQKSEWPIGNVVVFDTARAAAACNMTYYDCRGRCIGCFADSDYIEAVCVNAAGTMFLK